MIIESLKWKYPDAVITTQDDVIVDWRHPTVPQPNKIEIEAIKQEFVSYQAAILYQKKRAGEYPSVGDQLDAIWKLLADPKDPDGLAVQAAYNAVKEKYPKAL